MSFSINTNVTSLQAQNYLAQSSSFQAKTINSVTSGLRIVNSGDDAAGLAVANTLQSSQAVLTQGVQNANNGLATLQTIDGGLSNINTLLDRAQTLATESASGTFSGNRSTLNTEFQSVLTEINRQSQAIGLNQGGQFAKALSVYIGGGQGSTAAAQTANGTINIDLSQSAVDSKSLGLAGVQATALTGTNLAASSATSVSNILADTTNKTSETVSGSTSFTFRGAGFSGANGVQVSVNLTGVTDVSSLATAVNSAIQAAGSGSTTAATAFKNANIVASVSTDASGNQSLSFNAGNAAFQVQAGDGMANALMGNFNNQGTLAGTNTAATVSTSSGANTMDIKFNGSTTATTVTLSSANTGASVSKAAIAADLNSNTAFNTLGIATVDSANHLIIQSKQTGVGSGVSITGVSGDLSNALGLTVGTGTSANSITDAVAGANVTGTVTGAANTLAAATAVTAAENVIVRFQGSGLASPVDVKLSYSTSDTGASVLSKLATAVSSNSQLQAAGIKLATTTAGTPLSFTNSNNQLFSVQTAGDSGNVLGMGTYNLANASSATSMDYSSITGTTANTAGAAQLQFSIAGGQSFTLTTAALTGAATATDDATNTAAINQVLATNSATAAAGITATVASGILTLSSSNGTSFRVQDLTAFSGLTAAAGTSAIGANTSTATPQSATYDAGGGQVSKSLSFSAIQYGGDVQTINISSQDSTGASHQTAVVLQNNAIARNGGSIDNAIAAINTKLQQTNDPTLQGIVAVKENVGGQEQIKFMGTSAFQVTAGTTASGAGVGSQGTALASSQSAGGGTADISTSAGAAAAINALSAAVAQFGTAQAAVGRGENNLNYATNLAQSQLTNEASAESTIKDANLAQEAANLTKAQILVQAGTAALAQANSAPQQLLSLLQGH